MLNHRNTTENIPERQQIFGNDDTIWHPIIYVKSVTDGCHCELAKKAGYAEIHEFYFA